MAKNYSYGGTNLTLSIRDQGGLIRNFHKVTEDMDKALKRELVNIAEDMLGDAKDATPVKTGALKDALDISWSKSGYVFELGWDEETLRSDPRNKGGRWYAPFVELGANGRSGRFILYNTFTKAQPGKQFAEVLEYIINKHRVK